MLPVVGEEQCYILLEKRWALEFVFIRHVIAHAQKPRSDPRATEKNRQHRWRTPQDKSTPILSSSNVVFYLDPYCTTDAAQPEVCYMARSGRVYTSMSMDRYEQNENRDICLIADPRNSGEIQVKVSSSVRR